MTELQVKLGKSEECNRIVLARLAIRDECIMNLQADLTKQKVCTLELAKQFCSNWSLRKAEMTKAWRGGNWERSKKINRARAKDYIIIHLIHILVACPPQSFCNQMRIIFILVKSNLFWTFPIHLQKLQNSNQDITLESAHQIKENW
jgi:hypothetical protein